MKRIILQIAISTVIVFHSVGQVNQNNAGAPIMSDQFRLTLNHDDSQIEFYQQNYIDSTIDVRLIKSYAKLDIDDYVRVTPPDLTSFENVTVMIGVTPGLSSSIVVWLVGNYGQPEVTFFLDNNQDRDFTNDGKPLEARAGSRPRNVAITQDGRERLLTVSVPKSNVEREKGSKSLIENSIAVGFFAGVGSGTTRYRYTDVSSLVDLTEKNLGLSISYNTRSAMVGISGTYQNHNYYTSYMFVVNELGNTIEHVNRDIYPKDRFQWAIFGGPKINLGKYSYIMPMIKYGQTSFLDPTYVVDLPRAEPIEYQMKRIPFFELGLRMEFAVGVRKAVFVEIARNSTRWEPEGLSDFQDYFSESAIVKFNVGYRFGL